MEPAKGAMEPAKGAMELPGSPALSSPAPSPPARDVGKESSSTRPSPIRSLASAALIGSSSELGLQHESNIVLCPEMNERACGSDATGQTPLVLLTKGEEQVVHIPLKTILIKVAEELPAKAKPEFEYHMVGTGAYQAFVNIDVSGTRYSVDPHVKVARVPGQICASKKLAEISAIKNTFQYLESSRFIYVKDYSRRIASELDEDSVYLEVNSALYVLDQVLAKWSFSIDNITQFRDQLLKKDEMSKVAGPEGKPIAIYSEVVDYLGSFVTMYLDKHRSAYLQFMKFEDERRKFMKQSEEKTSKLVSKGLRQTVNFTARDVLDYVVSKFGLGVAKYSNEVVHGFLFIGNVKLSLPSIANVGCGGRTIFTGPQCSSARIAEEGAAARTLRFFEAKLKVTVTDMNYAERVVAKELQQSYVALLGKTVELAAMVKTDMSNMSDCMRCGVDIFGEVKEFSSAPFSNDEAIAMKFCATGMVSAHHSFLEDFKDASVKLQKIEDYRHRDADDEDF